MKNKLLTLAGALALLATLGHFYAKPLLAQVRAALVQNVDDPGRIPYQALRACFFSGNAFCSANLPPVPAGKRLVITHVSGFLRENLPGGTLVLTTILTQLGGGSYSRITIPVTFTGSDTGRNYFAFDQSALLVCDAGQSPSPSVSLGGVPSADSQAEFNLTGYMLDCSTGPCAPAIPQ